MAARSTRASSMLAAFHLPLLPRNKDWMRVAQAFAGPPGEGRKPGQFPDEKEAAS